MPDEKLDRRVKRTRESLRAALLSLISEKGYQNITVQDITERADINRVTFYFHYKDKDDLLYRILEEVNQELDARNAATESLEDWLTQDALLGFEHIAAYADLYRALFQERGLLAFLGRLMDNMADTALAAESRRLPPEYTPPFPLEIMEHFYAGAFMGLARWWLLYGGQYTPEQMAAMYRALETPAIEALLRKGQPE